MESKDINIGDEMKIDEQTVLFKHLAGSKLYGTDLPESDTDFKEIFIPSPREILLGRTTNASQTTTGNDKGKNTSEDEDVTRMSVQKFLMLCAKGDVGCIETLFADSNEDAVIYEHSLWGFITERHRSELFNRSIGKAIGYMRSQVNRYVVRGSRADAVDNIVSLLASLPKGDRLESHLDKIENAISGFEFSSLDTEGSVTHLNICNRKAPLRNKVGDTYDIYKKLQDEYGNRTKAAQNMSGVDRKGIQHCARIGEQTLQLLKEGKIEFPVKNAEYYKGIRKGLVPIEGVTEKIDSLFQEIESLGVDSDYSDSIKVAETVSTFLHLDVMKKYIESQFDYE